MWITAHVDVPTDLLQAQRAGRLVVFAGAGVSIPAPSSHPAFSELIQRLGSEASREPDYDAPDQFLGQLTKEGFDVHRRVHALLSREDSQPNEIHGALIRLFSSPTDCRIVTTNHDPHFGTAGDKAWGFIERFYAPALPIGGDFAGVVYLHGCVEREPARLVLTNSNFGEAYLYRAWATRFLRDMYLKYDVLFIGYRHNEPLMKYLAYGLPAEARRYAFTPKDEAESWLQVGVTPITYPRTGESAPHGFLIQAVTRWADRASMGYMAHEVLIREGVEAGPPVDRETHDYLLDVLAKADLAQFFARYARGAAWLDWARRTEAFKRIFSSEPLDEATWLLARWFSEHFSCEHVDLALVAVWENGGLRNETTWNLLALEVWRQRERLTQETLGQWIVTFLQQIPERMNSYLEYILHSTNPTEHPFTVMLLFESLTEPTLTFEAGVEIEKKERFRPRVGLRGDDFWLRKTWDEKLMPHLGQVWRRLAQILTNHIEGLHGILRSYGEATEQWDPVSYMRPAIEHVEGGYSTGPDFLIDASRDLIEWLAQESPSEAEKLVSKWADSSSPVLKRLAIHGLRRLP